MRIRAYKPTNLRTVKPSSLWLEYHTGLSRKAVLNLKWTDSFVSFGSDVQLFISLLPKRGEYVLVNRKGKKIDRNLVRHRLKRFEEVKKDLLFF